MTQRKADEIREWFRLLHVYPTAEYERQLWDNPEEVADLRQCIVNQLRFLSPGDCVAVDLLLHRLTEETERAERKGALVEQLAALFGEELEADAALVEQVTQKPAGNCNPFAVMDVDGMVQ